MLDKKIGILANSLDLKAAIENLYENDIKSGRIIIDILDSDIIDEQGIALEKKGAKAIIARSGGYRHTIGKVNIPVINMKIYIQDILHSIMMAEKFNKTIVLVISDIDDFVYEEWKPLIKTEVILERFYSVDEIEGVILKYKSKQSNFVIVGGGIPCSYARKHRLDFVDIIASDETIHDVISRAFEIVDNLYEIKYKNNVLNNILNEVHDAVISINKDEKIIIYNQRAAELLKKNSQDVLGYRISDVFPELCFLAQALNDNYNKIKNSNEIVQLKKIVVTVNVALMEIDSQVVGALCTFQDITKLQSLEKKIRYELNKKGLIAKYSLDDIIAFDPLMKKTLSKAVKIGMCDSTAMLYGESGTGKEMIAQSIHNISKRSNEPFVAVNCAALTESLLESELFGYEEGAFTGARKKGKPGLFELAHGGTIFLDEINSIPINLQTKLLRVLEEKEVMRIGSDYVIPLDVRILSAANEDLNEKIKNGSFRSDLFYRLTVLELSIPPLRKRKNDIIPLFKYFISCNSNTNDNFEVSGKIEHMLLKYSWPGNVRQLRNIAERYILFGELDISEDEIIDLNDRNDINNININDKDLNTLNNSLESFCLDLKEIDKYVELKVIDMLENQGMSKNEIAKTLGISRSSLWNKLNNTSKDV